MKPIITFFFNYAVSVAVLLSFNIVKNVETAEEPAVCRMESNTNKITEQWPYGEIFFKFDSKFNETEREKIYSAIREWEEKTCIRFFLADKNYKGRLAEIHKLHDGDESITDYGMVVSGKTWVNLSQSSIGDKATLLHEFGHLIGLPHEHQRMDRDQFVKINWNEIENGAEEEFCTEHEWLLDVLIFPYDYGSIMHYGYNAFLKHSSIPDPHGRRYTIMGIEGKIPAQYSVAERVRDRLSDADVFRVNYFYKCEGKRLQRPISGDPESFLLNQRSHKFRQNPHILYQIEDSFTNDQKLQIGKAIEIWEKKTCLSFIHFLPNDRVYNNLIYFEKSKNSSCHADLGFRIVGKTAIHLSDACAEDEVDILRLMLKVFGYVPEHQRADRDQYIIVYENRIRAKEKEKFKIIEDPLVKNVFPYDYQSITHAAYNEGAKKGKITVEGKAPLPRWEGRRTELSQGDLDKVNFFFNCPDLDFAPKVAHPQDVQHIPHDFLRHYTINLAFMDTNVLEITPPPTYKTPIGEVKQVVQLYSIILKAQLGEILSFKIKDVIDDQTCQQQYALVTTAEGMEYRLCSSNMTRTGLIVSESININLIQTLSGAQKKNISLEYSSQCGGLVKIREGFYTLYWSNEKEFKLPFDSYGKRIHSIACTNNLFAEELMFIQVHEVKIDDGAYTEQVSKSVSSISPSVNVALHSELGEITFTMKNITSYLFPTRVPSIVVKYESNLKYVVKVNITLRAINPTTFLHRKYSLNERPKRG